ncbi:carbohydrate-binding module family 13 protein [Scleroderma yunnanense]
MACIQSGGIYALINDKGGTCLDLSGGDNRSIIGYPFHNGPNQAWIFHRQGDKFVIKSAGTGSYLGIEGQPRDGASVVAVGWEYAWEIQDEPGVHGSIRLFAPGTPFNIDLTNYGDSTPGTPI